MAKRFLMQMLFLVVSVGSFAQTYRETYDSLDIARIEVLYDLTYREDSTHLDWARRERMILLIGNRISSFQSYRQFMYNPIAFQKMQEGTFSDWFNTDEAQQYTHRFFYCLYKNHPERMMTYNSTVFLAGRFYYEEPLGAFDWEILDDTMSVKGYLCQKAVCQYGGRHWEAWFTDELPFSDGPWKFHGLPGLILKVADTHRHYCFDFISIGVPDAGRYIEWFNDVYMETTRKGFFKVEDDLRENIMSHFDERISLEAQKRVYRVMKSRNNPIELDRK